MAEYPCGVEYSPSVVTNKRKKATKYQWTLNNVRDMICMW